MEGGPAGCGRRAAGWVRRWVSGAGSREPGAEKGRRCAFKRKSERKGDETGMRKRAHARGTCPHARVRLHALAPALCVGTLAGAPPVRVVTPLPGPVTLARPFVGVPRVCVCVCFRRVVVFVLIRLLFGRFLLSLQPFDVRPRAAMAWQRLVMTMPLPSRPPPGAAWGLTSGVTSLSAGARVPIWPPYDELADGVWGSPGALLNATVPDANVALLPELADPRRRHPPSFAFDPRVSAHGRALAVGMYLVPQKRNASYAREDPAKLEYLPARCELSSPWLESVSTLGLPSVLLHNCLNDGQLKELSASAPNVVASRILPREPIVGAASAAERSVGAAADWIRSADVRVDRILVSIDTDAALPETDPFASMAARPEEDLLWSGHPLTRAFEKLYWACLDGEELPATLALPVPPEAYAASGGKRALTAEDLVEGRETSKAAASSFEAAGNSRRLSRRLMADEDVQEKNNAEKGANDVATYKAPAGNATETEGAAQASVAPVEGATEVNGGETAIAADGASQDAANATALPASSSAAASASGSASGSSSAPPGEHGHRSSSILWRRESLVRPGIDLIGGDPLAVSRALDATRLVLRTIPSPRKMDCSQPAAAWVAARSVESADHAAALQLLRDRVRGRKKP